MKHIEKTLPPIYIGIDISKKIFDICCFDKDGKLINRMKIEPTRQGFISLIKQIPDGYKPIIAMESTGSLSGNFRDFLSNIECKIIVSDPYEVSRLRDVFYKSVKTEQIDAFVIAQTARMNELKDSQKEDKFIFLQDLLERSHDLKDRQTALINQLKDNLTETFPEIENEFYKISSKAALAILLHHQKASDFLDANDQHIQDIVRQYKGKFPGDRVQ